MSYSAFCRQPQDVVSQSAFKRLTQREGDFLGLDRLGDFLGEEPLRGDFDDFTGGIIKVFYGRIYKQ